MNERKCLRRTGSLVLRQVSARFVRDRDNKARKWILHHATVRRQVAFACHCHLLESEMSSLAIVIGPSVQS
jgi:hypothetical protein